MSIAQDHLTESIRILTESYQAGKPTTFHILDNLQEIDVFGIVIGIDQLERRILLRHDQGKNWVTFDDIIKINE